jgi:hypothetical protein
MKKSVVLFLILVLTVNSFAQDKPAVAPEKNVLKVNSIALIVATGSIFYERQITDLTSAQLGVGYLNYKIEDTKFNGLFLTPEFKFYVRKNAIDGFYVSPYLRYNRFNYENKGGTDTDEGSLTSFGGGVAFGRQWIFQKGFVIDFFFGGHYTSANVEITSGTEPPDVTKFDGFKTRVGLALGFAF